MEFVHVYFKAFPLVISILFMQFLCTYMFMGLLARLVNAMGRVLFTGWRHGDVTVWYQSQGCNNGPLWAKKEQLTEVVSHSTQQ